MTNWSEADEQALSALNERLNVKDPAENARNKLAVQTSVNQIITQLEQTARLLASQISTVFGRYVLMLSASAELRLIVNE